MKGKGKNGKGDWKVRKEGMRKREILGERKVGKKEKERGR